MLKNKIIFVTVFLVGFIVYSFFLDIYLTFIQLNDNNKFFAYSYIAFYVVVILFLIRFLYRFVVNIKKKEILDDKFKQNYRKWDETVLFQTKRDMIEKIAILLTAKDGSVVLSDEDRIKCEEVLKDVQTVNNLSDYKKDIDDILKKINEAANKLVLNESVNLAVMTAFAPKTALDMIIFLYRAFNLVQELLKLYGYRSSFIDTVIVMSRTLEGLAVIVGVDAVEDLIDEETDFDFPEILTKSIANAFMFYRVGTSCIKVLSILDIEKIKYIDIIKKLGSAVYNKCGNKFKNLVNSIKGKFE